MIQGVKTSLIPGTLVALTAAALLTGCGGSTPTVKKAEVEKTISATLEDQIGVAPDDLTCPGDLEGSEGTTMRCTLTHGGDELGVTVTVTDVEGEKVDFDAEVDEMDEGEAAS